MNNNNTTKSRKLLKSLNIINNENENAKFINLLEPVREKNMGKITNYGEPNNTHQIDTLYLPTDPKGFKYLILIQDETTRKLDGIPMKTLNSQSVYKEIVDLYNKKQYLEKPRAIKTDNGSEFATLKKNMKNVTFAQIDPYASRKLGLIERANQEIQKYIFLVQKAKQEHTKQTNTEWVDSIKDIIKFYNDNNTRKEGDNPDDLKKSNTILCKNKGDCQVLPLQTKVRYALDKPREDGPGRFRTGDQRWSKTEHTIQDFMIKQNQPILYKISNRHGYYTRERLQLIKDDETNPQVGQTLYKVDTLLDKKKIDNLVHYHVKYSDGNLSWEKRKDLILYIPEKIKEYETTHK